MTKLEEFITKTGLSAASISRTTGVSTGTLSLIRNGKLGKVSEDNIKKVNDFIDNYSDKKPLVSSSKIRQTSDLKMVEFTCNEIIIAQEMGAVIGEAGIGKTESIKYFARQHPEAILIETTPSTTCKSLLKQILDQQGAKDASGTVEELFNLSVDLFKKSEKILLIDEAENLTTNSLETIRRIHDFSRVPTVLIGTHALVQNLKGRQGELRQLSSRITNHWKMRGLNNEDRNLLFGDLGTHIKGFAQDIRRSCAIHNKAIRLSQLSNENLNPSHIQMASQTAILN